MSTTMSEPRTYDSLIRSDRPLSFCPPIYYYFAFSLDPVLSMEMLEEPAATTAAEKLPRGTYVGFTNKYLM